MARRTLGDRITSMEATYKENAKNVTDGLKRVEKKLDVQNGMLLTHDRQITRLNTKMKLLMGGIGGSGAIAGIIIGILNAL